MQHYKDQFTVAPLRHMLLNSISEARRARADGATAIGIFRIAKIEEVAVDVAADFLERV